MIGPTDSTGEGTIIPFAPLMGLISIGDLTGGITTGLNISSHRREQITFGILLTGHGGP